MTPLLLVGVGGHARACIDVIEAEGRWSIAGLIGLPDEVGRDVFGYPVVGADADLPAWAPRVDAALVTVGQIHTPDVRIRLFDLVARAGLAAPVIVSPRAYVSSRAVLGPGTIVLHGAVVNAGARIGCNGIVNSRALVEHDAQVGDHCHIATSATVNGDVQIGDGAFIGSGATVRQGLVIGARAFVGMGLRVTANVPPGARLTSA